MEVSSPLALPPSSSGHYNDGTLRSPSVIILPFGDLDLEVEMIYLSDSAVFRGVCVHQQESLPSEELSSALQLLCAESTCSHPFSSAFLGVSNLP